MKKVIFGAFFLFWSSAMFAQNNYDITFINKRPSFKFEKIYLFSMEQGIAIDSAENQNGTYTLKGSSRMPQLVSICMDNKGKRVFAGLILDETKTRVTWDKKVLVESSVMNQDLNNFRTTTAEGSMAQMKLRLEANALKAKYNGNFPDTTIQRLDSASKSVAKHYVGILKNGIISNKDNMVSVYLLFEYAKVFEVEFVKNFLKDYKYKDHVVLKETIKELESTKRLAIGAPFTDFTMNDIEGHTRKLSDYAGKGNYVLIDFWASWCGPCKGEMPNVVKAYEEYHSKGFEIVGVSLDKQKEAWVQAVKELNMSWPQLSDLHEECTAATLYRVKSIPMTLLIDPNGKIAAVGLRGKALMQKLAEIYN